MREMQYEGHDPEEVRIVALKESVLADNDRDADTLRRELREKGIFLVNLMSSPGAGKTSTLLALDRYLQNEIRWGVMEADIDSDVDARTLQNAGIPSIQLHTGGMCHLDADMTRQGIRSFGRDDLDLIVLENVGNLVCPAEFDTGAALNMTILSVPEGDDKPAKYPLMYRTCEILVVNKVDALPVFDFDRERLEADVRTLNPDIRIFYISARTGEGVEQLADHLQQRIREWSVENG